MMDFATDPVLAKRKADIFRNRELKKFGVMKVHELTLEQRA